MWKALVLMCGLLLLPQRASGLVILSLDDDGSDGDGNSHATTVEATDEFELRVTLDVTGSEQVIGLGFWLREGTSEGFLITGRTLVSSDFSQPTSTDAQVTAGTDSIAPPGADNFLDPGNDRDLGALLDPNLLPFTTGSDLLMRLRLASSPDTNLGSYQIEIGPSGFNVSLEWVDPAFGFHPFDSLGTPYTVRVVPEPATGGLVALGILALVAARRRDSPAVAGMPGTP